jgi:SAM-dependent methyltransferase
VDIDPIAIAHARAILVDVPGSDAVAGDLRQPLEVLDDPVTRGLLDLRRPVAVLLVATLHFIPDGEDPAGILRQLRGALAPGSFVAISHASEDGRPPSGQRDAQEIYARADNAVLMRSQAEIAALLDGWHVVDPGIVRCPVWQPDPGDELSAQARDFPGYSAVASI